MAGYINGAGITNFIAAASGNIQSGMLGADAVVFSGNIGSGQIITWHVASGTFTGFELGSGAVVSGRIASGQIGFRHLANGAVQSGSIASGQVSRDHLASGTPAAAVVAWYTAFGTLSGVQAVALHQGLLGTEVVGAERQSGLRMPCIGVTLSGAASGSPCLVVLEGVVPVTYSGGVASGFTGQELYVGSGGLIVNRSGFHDGASSGPGVGMHSGSYRQAVGLAISGGLLVRPSRHVTLATLSGQALGIASGQFPVSGLFV